MSTTFVPDSTTVLWYQTFNKIAHHISETEMDNKSLVVRGEAREDLLNPSHLVGAEFDEPWMEKPMIKKQFHGHEDIFQRLDRIEKSIQDLRNEVFKDRIRSRSVEVVLHDLERSISFFKTSVWLQLNAGLKRALRKSV